MWWFCSKILLKIITTWGNAIRMSALNPISILQSYIIEDVKCVSAWWVRFKFIYSISLKGRFESFCTFIANSFNLSDNSAILYPAKFQYTGRSFCLHSHHHFWCYYRSDKWQNLQHYVGIQSRVHQSTQDESCFTKWSKNWPVRTGNCTIKSIIPTHWIRYFICTVYRNSSSSIGL